MTEPAKPGAQTFEEWWGSVLPQVVGTSFREPLVTVVWRYCTAAWNAVAASERAARSFEIEGRDNLIVAQGQRIAELEAQLSGLKHLHESERKVWKARDSASYRETLVRLGAEARAERDEARRELEALSKKVPSVVRQLVLATDELAAALERK